MTLVVVIAHCRATLSVRPDPDQQRRRPQLFVGDVAPELVGKVEAKLAERVIELDRDRCLNQSRSDGCLVGQPANVGQSPGNFVALAQQELERLDRDVIPRGSLTTTSLLLQLETSRVGMQRVWNEVASQSPAGGPPSERPDAAMRRMVRRRTPKWGRRVVRRDVVNCIGARCSLLQPIGEPLGQFIALRRGHR